MSKKGRQRAARAPHYYVPGAISKRRRASGKSLKSKDEIWRAPASSSMSLVDYVSYALRAEQNREI
jgi:hypothetical protein